MTAMYANECKAIADDVIKVIDAIPTKQPNDRTNAPKSCQEYANQLQRELNRLIELLMCHASKYLIKMPTREDLEPKFLEQRSRSSSLSSAGPADLNKPRFEHTYNKLNQQIDCAIGATSIIAEQLATMKVENIKPWATSKMNELSSLNHVDEVIVCEKVTDVVAELFNILRKVCTIENSCNLRRGFLNWDLIFWQKSQIKMIESPICSIQSIARDPYAILPENYKGACSSPKFIKMCYLDIQTYGISSSDRT